MTIGWHFDNTYSKLSNTFKEDIKPTPVHDPKLVILNEQLAADLNLDFSKIKDKDLSSIFISSVTIWLSIFFLSVFEKSKFKVDASSSFKVTNSGLWTGVGLIFSLKVFDKFEYVLSKCQPMVILINLLQLDVL